MIYFGENQPEFEVFDFLPKNIKFRAQLLNAGDETIVHFDGDISNDRKFRLPKKIYQAMLLVAK